MENEINEMKESFNNSLKEYENYIDNLNENKEVLEAKYNALSKTYDFLRSGKPLHPPNKDEINELKNTIELLKSQK